jgi:prefoldin alpha subunit
MREEKKIEVTENQLIQMIQQEEKTLINTQTAMEKLLNLLKETITARDILEETKKTNGKVLISIGATMLVEMEAKNIQKCKKGIGENAYAEQGIEETIKWLKEKEEILKKQTEKLQQQYAQSEARYTDLAGIVKQIQAEKNKLAEKISKVPTISK